MIEKQFLCMYCQTFKPEFEKHINTAKRYICSSCKKIRESAMKKIRQRGVKTKSPIRA